MNAAYKRRLVSFALDAGHVTPVSATRRSIRTMTAHPPRPSAAHASVTSILPRSHLYPLRPRPNLRRLASSIVRKPEAPEEPEVFRDGDPSIIATDRAISQLKRVAERESNPNLALRVAVEPGGCHGYQYKMELTEELEDDDFAFEVDPGVKIVVDSISLALVRGSTIDYVTELIGSQFAIKDNPQAKGAGCGCGVSWEPNL